MNRLLTLFAALLIGLGSAVPTQAASSPMEASAAARVMVMLNLPASHMRSGSGYGGAYGDDAGRQMRRRLARRIAAQHGLTVLTDWPMEVVGVDCVVMQIGDGRNPTDVARELNGVRGVAWSQPLNEFEMQAAEPRRASGNHASGPRYNDRLLAAQHADARWSLAGLHRMATGKGVTIGIVDSRIDTTHPDLAGQIAVSGDFAAGGAWPERHGTGVAGIIAARANNTVGIVGVAPGAHVLALRACWERTRGGATVCNSLSLAKAIVFALDRHVDVLNLSLSGPADPLIAKLIAVAVARRIIVVVAVDPRQDAVSFPAALRGVVPVTSEALPARGTPVYRAPGIDVPTTEPGGKWSFVSGSSYAAAHVTGLVALLLQASDNAQSADRLLGPRGDLDACALVARQFRMDGASCKTAR